MTYKFQKLQLALRKELRDRAKARVDEMLQATDSETGLPMGDVLLTHIAQGRTFEVEVSVEVIAGEGDTEPTQPLIEVAKA